MITQEEVLDLIKTFEYELKKNNLEVEAISYANKDGLIYTHHYENPKERNIYSNSKSYVSVISGIAIDEKKISLDTTLADVLKDEINKENIEKAKQIRLKDLLTMSSGFNEAHLMDPVHNKYPEDWLNFALSFDLKKKPGEAFCYSNADTYMAARMVEKAYGRSLFEVMKEKLFDPLNMYVQKWDHDERGHIQAATGLTISIEEQIKLGIMLINEGEYKGKRILSKDYIKEATSFKISTNNWGWGDYGYQFWLVPEGEGFRADGAFGQLTCVFPKYNVIISTQRKDNTDPFPVLDLLRKCIFTKFH